MSKRDPAIRTQASMTGTIIRDDAEEPFETLIRLDDGRVIRAVECQWREAMQRYPVPVQRGRRYVPMMDASEIRANERERCAKALEEQAQIMTDTDCCDADRAQAWRAAAHYLREVMR